MAKISHRDDEVGVGISANHRRRRWNYLLRLTTLLSEGKAVLEELVASQVVETESPNFHAALDRGFLKKRKRSPRNHNNFLTNHQERVIFKKRIRGDQSPETSSGGDQSPKSTLCINPNFGKSIRKSAFHINPDSNKKRKRCSESGDSSSTSLEKSKQQRQLMDRHIIYNIQSLQLPPLPEAIRSRIIETGGRLEGAVCVIEKALFRTDVDSGQCRLSVPLRQVRERFLFPSEVELLLGHSDGGIQTTLIQPCLEECEITFGLWGSNTMYVLKNGWKSVCTKNGLRDGMVIRLWAFRRKSELCFALEAL